MRIGDYANLFVIWNAITYSCVLLYEVYDSSKTLETLTLENSPYTINPSVLRDGFCVSNKDSIWFSSHSLCFYVDLVFCVILYYYHLEGKSLGMVDHVLNPVSTNIIAHFGHGIGHFFVGQYQRDGDTILMYEDVDVYTFMGNIALLTFFWSGFMYAIHTTFSFQTRIIESAVITYIQLYVPQRFGFVYVQTVLLVLSAVKELSVQRKDKDFFYDLRSCIINIPIGLVGWLEATMCDRYLIYLGGHLVYDCTIPFSILLYYGLVRHHYLRKWKTK
jgi:hypothetical protein